MTFPVRVPARWLASAMARLAFMSGVGYVAAAYSVSRFLTRSRCRKLTATPADRALDYRDVSFNTEDGVRLAGWLIEPKDPIATVALFHGMRHSREALLSRIGLLHDAGYRCLAIDHRAHGESSGKRISFGWYEARDVRAASNWLEEQFPSQPKYAFGTSMGAAAICFAGPECGWKGIMLEGAYCDLNAAFRRRIGGYYPAWFGQLHPAVVWITERRLRMRMSDIRPVDAVARFLGVPVLVLSGERDLLAPPADGFELKNAIAASQHAVIPGAGHNDACEKGGEAYRDLLVHFLASVAA